VQEAENSLRSRTEKFMKLEVIAITDECLDVRSFLLKPHNQSFGLPPYEPGTPTQLPPNLPCNFHIHAASPLTPIFPPFVSRVPPGQYIPVRLSPKGPDSTRVVRFYSLSDAPNGLSYRITVKRVPDGLVSNHMHDGLSVGSIIESMVRPKASRPLSRWKVPRSY
jgi:ferredoxin-NADP reductase